MSEEQMSEITMESQSNVRYIPIVKIDGDTLKDNVPLVTTELLTSLDNLPLVSATGNSSMKLVERTVRTVTRRTVSRNVSRSPSPANFRVTVSSRSSSPQPPRFPSVEVSISPETTSTTVSKDAATNKDATDGATNKDATDGATNKDATDGAANKDSIPYNLKHNGVRPIVSPALTRRAQNHK